MLEPTPDAAAEQPLSNWQAAVSAAELQRRGAMPLRIGARQIALFHTAAGPRACGNRCPHEGYPLCEGEVNAAGVLTCAWHNWKFDLSTGENLYGGDGLRLLKAEARADGQVWIDLAVEPPALVQRRALAAIAEAQDDEDRPRITRELARLERDGGSLEQALADAIERHHERLRYGMTHAHAAAEAWLRLRDELGDPAERLVCGSEALGYLGRDTLREPERPYPRTQTPWDASRFLAAVQAQDEPGALAPLHGALAGDATLSELLPTLTRAALAHHNDFGHSLIYLSHLPMLVQRLGAASQAPLLRAWLRSLVYATREDLLPDFKSYAPALQDWPASGAGGEPAGRGARADSSALDPADFEARSVRDTLAAVLAAAPRHGPMALHEALLAVGARHLLRFDERVATRTDNPVADNIGWLDFSHAITFAHAARRLLPAGDALWREAILQQALFAGRNRAHLQPDLDRAQALATWRVAPEQAAAFDARCRAQVLDHGLGLDIFPAHWLKTWLAVRGEIAAGVAPATVEVLRAALNRLFAARFKQRHALRSARQALALVEREGG